MQNQKRVVIDYVYPQINNGEFFIKRVVDEVIQVQAHVFGDGHDLVGASLLFKHEKERKWKDIRMSHVMNDEWQSSFTVEKQGFYDYKVQAWIDHA
ncbi:MAG: DUF3416 domain-containing protein, partial [Bacteroidia bacterium]|nr:DUF3416 domain-containing protein [Bacteroidia bacterium]